MCDKCFMTVTPLFNIEREDWGASSILGKFDDGFYICIYSVRSDEYKIQTKCDFLNDSHFKLLHQHKCCGSLTDNKAYVHICVLDNNDR